MTSTTRRTTRLPATEQTFFETLRVGFWVFLVLGATGTALSLLWAARFYILGAGALLLALWLFSALCNWMFEGMPKWVQRCAFVGVVGYSLLYCLKG